MGKHNAPSTDKGHATSSQQGGSNSGSSGGKAVLIEKTGESIGRVGPEKGHTER